MRVLPILAVELALIAGLASCLISRKSSAFECSSQSDCDPGRICKDGFCIVGNLECGENCTSVGGICNGGTCTFSGTVTPMCPANVPCEIACTGTSSCAGALDCGQASSCKVTCSGNDSCVNQIGCSAAGACTVTCSGTSSCAGGVACGAGKCDVNCVGNDTCAAGTTCASACSCDVKCVGTSSCAAAAVCPDPPGQPDQCVDGQGCTDSPMKCNRC